MKLLHHFVLSFRADAQHLQHWCKFRKAGFFCTSQRHLFMTCQQIEKVSFRLMFCFLQKMERAKSLQKENANIHEPRNPCVSGRSRLTPEPRNRTAVAAGQMVGDSMRGPAGTAWRGRHGWQPRSSVRHWCNPIPPVFTAHSCSGNLWARVSCDPVGRGGHPSPPRRRQWSPPADRRNQPRDLVNGGATAMTPWVGPP